MIRTNKKYIFIFICIIGFILSLFLYLFKVVYPTSATVQESGEEEKVTIDVSSEQVYSNIEAFGRLYGYVRYFHPSDEAASLSTWEWNRFVEYGVNKVKHSENEEELKETLEDLFLPIAPTIKLYLDNQSPDQNVVDIQDGEVVAWQHYGVGISEEQDSLYKSQRTTAIVKGGEYELENNRLFDEFPIQNETINEKISNEIHTFIPLVLYKNESGTVGANEASKTQFEQLKNKLNSLDIPTQDVDVRYAGVIVTWNVLQHFYPYFHVTNSDWESQLLPALKDVSDDQNKDDYMNSIMHLLEKTKDGHALHTLDTFNPLQPSLPFIVEKVEGKLVVTVANEESGLRPGDIILSLNNKNPIDVLQMQGETIPGSPQFKEIISSEMLRHDNQVDLLIQREEETFELTVKASSDAPKLDLFTRKEDGAFKEIENGIYYIDLHRFNKLEEQMETLLNAKGIIIDLRDFNWNQKAGQFMEEIIPRLADKPVESPIARVMQTIYPNQKHATFDELPRYSYQPVSPKFTGKVVFLSFPGLLSSPEFWLGHIKDNQLATIIGQPTAGADGNIQQYSIPGNITGVFTGMEILNGDRTQTHIVGIQPDIHVQRTIEGIKALEDEYITRALEFILEGD